MILLRRLLGDVLRRQRQRQGRTLREVSSSARVSLGYLSEVERGQKEASSELLSSICDALDVRMSELMREVSDELALAELAESAASDPCPPRCGRCSTRCPSPRSQECPRSASRSRRRRRPWTWSRPDAGWRSWLRTPLPGCRVLRGTRQPGEKWTTVPAGPFRRGLRVRGAVPHHSPAPSPDRWAGPEVPSPRPPPERAAREALVANAGRVPRASRCDVLWSRSRPGCGTMEVFSISSTARPSPPRTVLHPMRPGLRRGRWRHVGWAPVAAVPVGTRECLCPRLAVRDMAGGRRGGGGPVEASVTAGGWGLSILPVHVARGRPARKGEGTRRAAAAGRPGRGNGVSDRL